MSERAQGQPDELLERDAELGSLRASAEAGARGDGRVLVLEGPAGIGKTALVGAACACAREAGLEPLVARGAELESAFGFGVVRQLLEPAVRAREDGGAGSAFAGAAAVAAPLLDVALPDPAPLPPAGPEAAATIVHGLYRLTVNLARTRPLALVVDDAHWADPASLRFLAYLGRRVGDLPVLLLVAARPAGEPGGLGVAALLVEGGASAALRPDPLSDAAAARVVRAAVPEAADALCRACHDVTGGNPFFLRELTVGLRELGTTGADEVLDVAPEGSSRRSGRASLAFPGPRATSPARCRSWATAHRCAMRATSPGSTRLPPGKRPTRCGRAGSSAAAAACASCTRSSARPCTRSCRPALGRPAITGRHGCSRMRTRRPSGWPRTCCSRSPATPSGPASGFGRPPARRFRVERPMRRSPICAGHWRSRRRRRSAPPCCSSSGSPRRSPST